jgi:uncharacterized protein YprB with RNaseH-like and TPR domain
VKGQITKALLSHFRNSFLWFDFETTGFNLAGKLLKWVVPIVLIG